MPGKHEVVISGIAGLFPESDDFEDLLHKLLNGIDLVTTDERRWTPGEMGVPAPTGKVKNPDEFDISLFGIPRKLVEITDPNTRLSVMQGFRAVCDAGINPNDISGSNTAVLMTSFTSETEDEYLTQNANLGTYGIIANSRAMQANRISFFLNLKGPSNVLDATWCGGAQAIQCAYDLISTGAADAAIIGSSSLIFKPQVSIHYQAMGKLSQDGKTRCYSSDASGYARSEACVTMFLQRAANAKRSYGTILGVSTLHWGLRSQTFSDFSTDCFEKFLKEVYTEAAVDPKDVAYYEGAGLASRPVDAKELNTIAGLFLKERTKPLLIGSVKSNLGHTEGASNLVSLVKTLIAADRGVIPPNLRYNGPNPDVPALVSGRMKVVTEPTPLEGDLLAVTDVGISGGTLSHIIVRRNPKSKPKLRKYEELPSPVPRLVLLSDRNKINLQQSIRRFEDSLFDEEFYTIINSLNKEGVKGHLFRGYTVVNGSKNIYNSIENYSASRKAERKPIWFVFSGMGSQWPKMGTALLRLPVFARAVQKCHDILAPKGIDLMDILTNEDPKVFDSILCSFVGIAAVQIGLVDVLREVGIEPDFMIGHSVGELGCGYADGCLTLEQMIMSAYARGKASLEATLIRGTMAAVGLGYEEIKDQVPPTIDVACHNSGTSCTLSGPTKDMEHYINKLKGDGIFAKLVNVANIAYHSRYIKPAGPLLLDYLKPIIPEPTLRSPKWLSSSNPENQWDTELAKYSSAEYYTNNLLSAVLFAEVAQKIPPGSIIIEIAPHGLLQAILKRSQPKSTLIPLTSRFDEDNLMYLMGALGKIYLSGVSLDIEKLYPPVEFPVSRGTPALSPFIGWQNTENFKLEVNRRNESESCWKDMYIEMRQEKFSSLAYHKIKGRVILPNSFYLEKVAKHFMRVRSKRNVMVEFERVRFFNKAEVPLVGGSCDINLQLQQGTGCYCVTYGNDGILISSGKLNVVDPSKSIKTPKIIADDSPVVFNGEDVIEFMESHGLSLESKFDVIKKVTLDKKWLKGTVTWNGGLVEFLNGLLTLIGFFHTKLTNSLHLVEEIELLTINFESFRGLNKQDFEVFYYHDSRSLDCFGITMLLPETKEFEPAKCSGESFFEVHRFVPHDFGEIGSGQSAINICYQLIIENALPPTDSWTKIKTVCIGKNFFHDALAALSKTSTQLHFVNAATENILMEQEMPSMRNEFVWIVSAKPLSSKLIEMVKSYAKKAFILAPVTETYGTEQVTEIFKFSSSFEKFLLSTFKANIETKIDRVYYENNYVSNLESKLMQANERNMTTKGSLRVVYLVGSVDSQSTILSIFDETNNLPHHQLLHFQLGNSSIEELDGNLTDLKVNFVWNNVGGTVRSFSGKSTGYDLLSNQGSSMYSLSKVLQTTEPSALGLNLNDVTGSLDKDEIGIFDYANAETMGVGKYDPLNDVFIKDDVLKWDKPSDWPISEAATVPLLYSLAMYILRYNNADVENSILINRGLLPLSQALISLALHKNIEVYVTVYGEEEKKQIMKMYPKLNSDNIFDCSKSSFHIAILNKTQGHGVYKVVNTFKEKDMIKPCTYCVSPLGVYMQVSMTPGMDKQKLGMLIFINEICVKGIEVDSMLNLSMEEKLGIRDDINQAIELGQVQPFSKRIIPEDSTNVDATRYLKSAKTKLIVNVSGKSESNINSLLNCSSDKTYVIINDRKEKSTAWLELAGWLLSRGARKICIVLKDVNVSGVSSLRLCSLQEKYSSVKLNLRSADCLVSETAIKKFIEDVDSGCLGAVFIMSSGNRVLVQNVDREIERKRKSCGLICLGKGAESTCERRNKQGLMTLCVRVGADMRDMKIAIEYMDALIDQSEQNPIVTVKSGLGKTIVTRGVEKHQYVPCSYSELRQLLALTTSTVPSFLEIPTHSPRKVYSKELSPMFVFPGLRVEQIRRLTRKLFYPALEVRLPKCQDLRKMASELSDMMAAMSYNMYTLVAEGWGGILALEVAAKLEALGKIVRVILIDAGPSDIKRWASELMRNPLPLISRYIRTPYKVKKQLEESVEWDEMVDAIISESQMTPHEKTMAVESLDLLRKRLQGVISSEPPNYKMKRPCYLFKIESNSKMDQSGLEDYLRTEAVVRVIALETEEEVVERITDEINSLALHEIEDGAYPPKEEFLKVSFVKGKSKATA